MLFVSNYSTGRSVSLYSLGSSLSKPVTCVENQSYSSLLVQAWVVENCFEFAEFLLFVFVFKYNPLNVLRKQFNKLNETISLEYLLCFKKADNSVSLFNCLYC